jgi:hypothetical protein
VAEPFGIFAPRPYPQGPAESEAFWGRIRAAISEGFCPTCSRRLEPREIPPAPEFYGGVCVDHGGFWQT